jgi:WD40 repeat protein
VTMVVVDNENPWPGLAPYEEIEEKFFFGRTTEVAALLRAVEDERLVVLYSRSGVGKSSLLQAGLFPELRKRNFLPIWHRWNHKMPEKAAPSALGLYAAQVVKQAPDSARKWGGEAPEARAEETTLWEYFHHREAQFWSAQQRLMTPVLVLDQFEEFFTDGSKTAAARLETERFFQELSDLVYLEREPPKRLIKRLDSGNGSLNDYVFDRVPLRVVISLREDYLAQLGELREKWSFPTLRKSEYRLDRLSMSAARECIERPAPGLVDPAVVDSLVSFLGNADIGADASLTATPFQNQSLHWVEPALLSLICRELNDERKHRDEERRKKGDQGGPSKIDPELMQLSTKKLRSEEILANFYKRAIADVPMALTSFVENELISKGGRHREIKSEESVLDDKTTDRSEIEKGIKLLIDQRILHRRKETDGEERLELTHDLLCRVVAASRDERERDKERQVAELKGRRRRYLRYALALVCVALAFAAGVQFYERRIAQNADEFKRRSVEAANEIKRRKDLVETGRKEQLGGDPAGALNSLYQAYSAGETSTELGFLINQAIPQKQAALLEAASLKLKHTKGVYSATYSPDESLVVTASKDGTAKIWNANNGQLITTLPNRDDKGKDGDSEVTSASFDRSGTRIVTGGSDGKVRIWALENPGKPIPLADPDSEEALIYPAIFSPAADQVLAASSSGNAYLWKSNDGAPVGPPLADSKAPIMYASYSKDGQWLVTAKADSEVIVWDANTHKYAHELDSTRRHWSAVRCAVFSPDGERIASVDTDGQGRLWKRDGTWISNLESHHDLARRVVFSHDGKEVVTTSRDGTAHVSDGVNGNYLFPLLGHAVNRYVYMAAFPQGDGADLIATAGDDGTAKLWDAKSGRMLSSIEVPPSAVYWVEFNKSGSRLLTAGEDGLPRIWDISKSDAPELKFVLDGRTSAPAANAPAEDPRVYTYDSVESPTNISSDYDLLRKRLYAPFLFTSKSILKVHFSPDGDNFLTVDGLGNAELFDVATKAKITLPSKDWAVTDAVFSPKGDSIALGYGNGDIAVSDLKGSLLTSYQQLFNGPVYSVEFLPNGTQIIASGKDRQRDLVKSFDLKSMAPMFPPLPDCTDPIISSDGRKLITLAQQNKIVNISDIVGDAKPTQLNLVSGKFVCAQFSPGGLLVVTADDTGLVVIWNSTTGESVLPLPKGLVGQTPFAAFSPDGKMVVTNATSATNPTAEVWEAHKGGKRISSLKESGVGAAVFATFSRDSSLLFTMDLSDTARVWDVTTGNVLARLKGQGQTKLLSAMELSPSGKELVTGAQDQAARVWKVDTVPPSKPDVANVVNLR